MRPKMRRISKSKKEKQITERPVVITKPRGVVHLKKEDCNWRYSSADAVLLSVSLIYTGRSG